MYKDNTGRLFIKDGCFMIIDEEGKYHIADYISIEEIKNKLREKVKNIENLKMKNLNSLIINSIKEVTGFKKVTHCKVEETSTLKIKTNDPLYESLVKFIQNLEDYQNFLQKNEDSRKCINKRKAEGLKEKENADNYFDMYLNNKYKRVKRYSSR